MAETLSTAVLVSVLMPVYNASKHLREAIDSILSQSYTHFELLIINDGSTDDSESIIRSYTDPRIRLIVNPGNRGLIYSLNKGIAECRGTYIARMDADDISLPDRIGEQLAYMEQHPEVGVCGCDYTQFSESSETAYTALSGQDEILSQMIFNSPVVHPSLMLRRSVLEQLDPVFNAGYSHSEDYELWSKLILLCRFSAVHKTLFRYRIHASQVTSRHADEQQRSASRVRQELLAKLGFRCREEDVALLSQMAAHRLFDRQEDLDLLERFLEDLIAQNRSLRAVKPEVFGSVLAYKWYTACGYTTLGLYAFRKYRRSALRAANPQSMQKLLLKCLVRRFTRKA